MTSNVLASELAEKASQTLEPIYGHLGRMADEVVRCRPPRATLTETHFGGLQRIITDLLNEEPGVLGMGFAAAPGLVDGSERCLPWWQRRNGRISRLRLNFDPNSIDVYDYLQMDWYQLAQHGQTRVAYGPYVDYAGSDMYTITVTIPVLAGEEFLGVVGADLVVGDVEHRLLEVLRGAGEDAVVVSTERRVIAANTPRWLVGSRLAGMPEEGPATDPTAFREVAEMPLGTGWVLAIAWPEAVSANSR